MIRVPVVLIAALATNCTLALATYGAVSDADSAIKIGLAACKIGPEESSTDKSYRWRARDEGDHWHVWLGYAKAPLCDGISVDVKKRDGTTTPCVHRAR